MVPAVRQRCNRRLVAMAAKKVRSHKRYVITMVLYCCRSMPLTLLQEAESQSVVPYSPATAYRRICLEAAQTDPETGLPSRFPPPPFHTAWGPFTAAPGPADDAGLESGLASPILDRLHIEHTRPGERPPTIAEIFRRRGQPDDARDPMDQPNQPELGDPPPLPLNIRDLWLSAAKHAAYVFKRLVDAGSDIQANDLDAHFMRILGPAYAEAVIQSMRDNFPLSPTASELERAENERENEGEEDQYDGGPQAGWFGQVAG